MTVPDPDTAYFQNLIGRHLSLLMRFASTYTPDQQQTYISLLQQHVASHLGSAPKTDPKTGGLVCEWPSFMCDDHSTIEYSLSFGKKGTVVRMAVEPVARSLSNAASKVDNKHNLIAARQLLSDVSTVTADGFDASAYALLENCIAKANAPSGDSSTDEDGTESDGTMIQPAKHTQMMFGFDFTKSRVMVKGYCVSALANMDAPDANNRAVGEFCDLMNVTDPWRVVCSYREEVLQSRGIKTCCDIVSCDYVDSNARVKVYTRYSHTTSESLASHLTLNKRIPISNIETYADKLWSIFFSPGQTLTGASSILFYYDMRPGEAYPCSKVYIPVLRHCKTELEAIGKVCRVFEEMGVKEVTDDPIGFKEKYTEFVKDFYKYRDLGVRSGGHTHCCISFKPNAPPECSIYFNAELFAPERTETRVPTVLAPSVSDPWQNILSTDLISATDGKAKKVEVVNVPSDVTKLWEGGADMKLEAFSVDGQQQKGTPPLKTGRIGGDSHRKKTIPWFRRLRAALAM